VADRPLEPDDFICFAVYSTGHAFSRVYKPLLEKLDVTYPQYLVLVALWAKDNQTVGSLGDMLFLESSTLTPLLKRMEKLELLTRSRDMEDERQVRIRLTEKGSALRGLAQDFPACVDGATGLAGDALKKLRDDIRSVRAALHKAAG
jgi:DNA-binding MarR family transcriptional regulator